MERVDVMWEIKYEWYNKEMTLHFCSFKEAMRTYKELKQSAYAITSFKKLCVFDVKEVAENLIKEGKF
jgi:hypothetical protein